MKKFLLSSIVTFVSFWFGVFIACTGYSNGDDEQRKTWDEVFHIN